MTAQNGSVTVYAITGPTLDSSDVEVKCRKPSTSVEDRIEVSRLALYPLETVPVLDGGSATNRVWPLGDLVQGSSQSLDLSR